MANRAIWLAADEEGFSRINASQHAIFIALRGKQSQKTPLKYNKYQSEMKKEENEEYCEREFSAQSINIPIQISTCFSTKRSRMSACILKS